MNPNPFNLCPSCLFSTTCVLTNQKHTVWSCSEYEERKEDSSINIKPTPIQESKKEPEMALV